MTKADMRIEVTAILQQMQALTQRLARLHAELHNRPPRTRGDPYASSMSQELAQQIIDYHRANPAIPQHMIAKRFNLNQGRISETLAGKRA
jgi:two-component sensor histidine kinase